MLWKVEMHNNDLDTCGCMRRQRRGIHGKTKNGLHTQGFEVGRICQ